MTRKDYVALAAVIALCDHDNDRECQTIELVAYCRSTNNLFDEQRFREAITKARSVNA